MSLIVRFKLRPGMISAGMAVTAIGIGLAIFVRGDRLGWRGLNGARLAAFLVGGVALVTAIFLFQRGLRRRARLDAIADLLPSYRRRHHDEFLFDEPDLDDDLSTRIPHARGEVRAATRALLVSLEDEMRREMGRVRRTRRPSCRRARLRAAGRSESRRRRISVRIDSTPS